MLWPQLSSNMLLCPQMSSNCDSCKILHLKNHYNGIDLPKDWVSNSGLAVFLISIIKHVVMFKEGYNCSFKNLKQEFKYC